MLCLILLLSCVGCGGDCGLCSPWVCYGYWGGPAVYPGCYGYAGYPGYPGYYGWAANVPSGSSAPVSTAQPASARVVVNLPPDARFFIGDRAWSLDAATHAFKTPPLSPNFRHEYTLRAEVTRNGRTVSQSKLVTVLAGKETVVEFGQFPAAELARP